MRYFLRPDREYSCSAIRCGISTRQVTSNIMCRGIGGLHGFISTVGRFIFLPCLPNLLYDITAAPSFPLVSKVRIPSFSVCVSEFHITGILGVVHFIFTGILGAVHYTFITSPVFRTEYYLRISLVHQHLCGVCISRFLFLDYCICRRRPRHTFKKISNAKHVRTFVDI